MFTDFVDAFIRRTETGCIQIVLGIPGFDLTTIQPVAESLTMIV